MYMKTGVIHLQYANHVKKNALLNGMKSLVKDAGLRCASIEIGITLHVSANPAKRNAKRSGMRNPARNAAL